MLYYIIVVVYIKGKKKFKRVFEGNVEDFYTIWPGS